MSQICPRFGKGRHENNPSRGLIWSTPWWNEFNSGQACRPCRGSCSPIPGRDYCFGDLPGDGIVVSSPPQSLKHSEVLVMTYYFMYEVWNVFFSYA